jgi:hypothetical protein
LDERLHEAAGILARFLADLRFEGAFQLAVLAQHRVWLASRGKEPHHSAAGVLARRVQRDNVKGRFQRLLGLAKRLVRSDQVVQRGLEGQSETSPLGEETLFVKAGEELATVEFDGASKEDGALRAISRPRRSREECFELESVGRDALSIQKDFAAVRLKYRVWVCPGLLNPAPDVMQRLAEAISSLLHFIFGPEEIYELLATVLPAKMQGKVGQDAPAEAWSDLDRLATGG